MKDDTGEQFVAYFVPTDESLARRLLREAAGSSTSTAADEDYTLLRNYNWHVTTKGMAVYVPAYVLAERDGCVYYDELETRVRLMRRRAHGGPQVATAKSRMILHRRDDTADERAQREARLVALKHPREVEASATQDSDEEAAKVD